MGDFRGVVSARLRQARMDAGLSQEEMARRLGLTQVGYSGLERGRTPVRMDTLLHICEIVGKPVTFFTGRDTVQVEGLSPMTQEVAGIMENLPNRKKEAILGYARFMAQERAKQPEGE
jgi:transcriptional regulator with XRE-family HTH domain